MATKNVPADETQELIPASLKGFYSQTEDELNSFMTFDEAFIHANLSEADLTFQGSLYSAVEKDALVNRPFKIRSWKFSNGDYGKYVIAFIVIHGTNENVLFTDGSAGIYRQLEHVTQDRLKNDNPYPLEYLLVPNGLRASEYGLDEFNQPVKLGDPAAVSRAKTFYLA